MVDLPIVWAATMRLVQMPIALHGTTTTANSTASEMQRLFNGLAPRGFRPGAGTRFAEPTRPPFPGGFDEAP
jgi:hypothetical protein